MSKWQDKSNEEINIAVTCHAHNCEKWEVSEDGKSFYHCGHDGSQFFEISVLDYCGNWGFAGPVLIDSNIVITPCMGSNAGDATAYSEHSNPITLDFHDNEHALRAAMIVYLEMNGVQPNE